jgi:hypothetical protein
MQNEEKDKLVHGVGIYEQTRNKDLTVQYKTLDKKEFEDFLKSFRNEQRPTELVEMLSYDTFKERNGKSTFECWKDTQRIQLKQYNETFSKQCQDIVIPSKEQVAKKICFIP